MTKEQAIAEAKHFKQYYPFRRVFIYTEDEKDWRCGVGKTMARANNLVREGYQVFLVE